jgi:hypothetical protein
MGETVSKTTETAIERPHLNRDNDKSDANRNQDVLRNNAKKRYRSGE